MSSVTFIVSGSIGLWFVRNFLRIHVMFVCPKLSLLSYEILRLFNSIFCASIIHNFMERGRELEAGGGHGRPAFDELVITAWEVVHMLLAGWSKFLHVITIIT